MDEFLRNDVNSHQILLINHEAKLKNIEATILDIKQSYKSLVDEVADIKNTLGTLKNVSNEISHIKVYLDSFIQSVKEIKEDIYKRMGSSDSKIVSLESAMSNDKGTFEGILGEYKQCILDQNREGIRLNIKIEGKASEASAAIKNLEKSLKEWSESKLLELLPKDNTYLFENFRNELLKKLEVIGIDCMNAVLKAGNISNQIPMLEKRIENISLILKKYEINQ